MPISGLFAALAPVILVAMGAKSRPAAPGPAPSGWASYRLFYEQFRRHFLATGAIAPSSAFLARAITAPLAHACRAGRTGLRVLEVGPGTGVFTRAILQQLRSGDALDIYEINPAFEPLLRARLMQARVESRGITVGLHIADICQSPPAAYDYIVSGLPLNNFAPEQVSAILALFMERLSPGGVLSYFEYAGVRGLKSALVHNPAERDRLRQVGAVVHQFLSTHRHRESLVPLNLLPAVARHVSRASLPA